VICLPSSRPNLRRVVFESRALPQPHVRGQKRSPLSCELVDIAKIHLLTNDRNLLSLSRIVRIALGPDVFNIYYDFLVFNCPTLATMFEILDPATDMPQLLQDPKPLSGLDPKVFVLFIQWLYTESLLNKHNQPAYQDRLMQLWILGKKLNIPRLQNEAIDMLEERRQID